MLMKFFNDSRNLIAVSTLKNNNSSAMSLFLTTTLVANLRTNQ